VPVPLAVCVGRGHHGFAVGAGTLVGSAALALWVVVRYREFGPKTLRSSLVACAAAYGLLRVTGFAMEWIAASTHPAVALLLVAVPSFTCAWWSAGVLLRTFVAGGPNGPMKPVRKRIRRR
jgi:hypothetical protein